MESKNTHRSFGNTAPVSADEAAIAFAALGSAARLSILRCLVRAGQDGLTVGVLQDRTGFAASTLSHHVKALMSAGVITQARDGRSLICRAQFDWIEALADFLIRECCADADIYTERLDEGFVR